MDHNAMIKEGSEIVESSDLTREDKDLLLSRLPYCETGILSMFVEVSRQDPFSVDVLVKNLKKKLDAQGNLSKIHEIANQEREDIETLLNDVE